MRARLAPLLCVAALAAACGAGRDGGNDSSRDVASGPVASGATTTCPARAAAKTPVPGTRPEHEQLAYWLGRYTAAELDAPLMGVEDIDAYDRGVGHAGQLYSQRDLLQTPGRNQLERELRERLTYLRERLTDGRYVAPAGTALDAAVLDQALPELTPTLHVALGPVTLRCGPLPLPLHDGKPTGGAGYDRNACSAARAQEVLQVLAQWPNGMRLARTRYALGFIEASAPLSPALPAALAATFVRGPRAFTGKAMLLTDEHGTSHALTADASVPVVDGRALLATADGVVRADASALTSATRPLTRRALLTDAFSFLGAPYGFGDAGGGRDCSRLQLDLFERFGIALPRHSAWQAQAGSYTVDVSAEKPDAKLARLDQVARGAAVLLAFPGHVMLYLGRDDGGTPRVLHALGEYVQPCAGGDGAGGSGGAGAQKAPRETIMQVERTLVSDLALGAGSSRGSLLERIATLVVFGGPAPSAAVTGVATHVLPPAHAPTGECRDSTDARVFVSPARPVAGQPMRLIATTSRSVKQPALWVYGPDGAFLRAETHRLGGPPYTVWARLDAPAAGRHVAVFVDGETQLGCKPLPVRDQPLAPERFAADAPVWMPRFRWETDTLNLWAAFIEQLFDDPPDDERTWGNLHSLLRDPERNLLYDHLGLDEDDKLAIVPDCADLPFALRAYFAWKLRLPFAYRQCSRGREGVPPRCGLLHDHLMPREAADEVEAFSSFVNRHVRSGVHSATGRTHPEDNATDLYPVMLDRADLPPGTVYADPYGHVMMITKWFDQGSAPDAYGILMAAEAQPDNTIGRRRFFPGSFLFDPSTHDVGAGFKQFRPLTAERGPAAPGEDGNPSEQPNSSGFHLVPLDNAALASSTVFPRFGLQQYAGTKDDFYERMDVLINPRPLDPHTRLRSLLDAFEEAARRRVLAVDTGETYMQGDGRGKVIAMPSGHDIFETTGPWEDYATPSRDMRLLIALDTVLALPERVRKLPERFALPQGVAPEQASVALQAELQTELGRRTFEYTRSDGKKQTLSLADVRTRAQALEIGYNANDCVELRWGAAEGSQELASCVRRAPAEQRARMERYRIWFRTRTRPPRSGGE